MNLLLEIGMHENGSYYFSDFGEALIYALLGFLIVFAGIAIIIAIIWLIGLLMRKTDDLAKVAEFFKRKRGEPDQTAEEPPQLAEERVAGSDEVPAEVKAAIVAAIMAYYENEKPECEFKVKRIKRL